jgi:hypothetical protein
MTAQFAIAIHDVAPSWLPESQEWRSLIAERTSAPVTLLVVPRFRLVDTWDGENLAWLQHQVAAGDEPVLHGYTHTTPDPDDEREFRGVSALEARGRVLAGLAALRTVGVYPRGFIAPCYNGACDRWFESERSGIAWWATRLDLRTRSRVMTAPAIGLGASTMTRRRMTPAAAQWGLRLAQRHHRYRIDLHPADLRHARLRSAGIDLVERALESGDQLVSHEALIDAVVDTAEASPAVAV